jgi:Holliday junction resolvase RusA-like endonuclease
MSVILALPWPPSVNKGWRPGFNAKKGTFCFFTDPKVKAYRWEVIEIVKRMKLAKLKGDIFAKITIIPARKGRVDVDNRLKVSFDALKLAGVYDDDSQINPAFIIKGTPNPPGSILFDLYEQKDLQIGGCVLCSQ